MHAVFAESGEKGLAGLGMKQLLAIIDGDGDFARIDEPVLGQKKDNGQNQYDHKEDEACYSHIVPLNSI